MKIVEKICKEWNSICRVFNIKENPLTYSHKDLLEFAEYYHKSQLNNDVALDTVIKCTQFQNSLTSSSATKCVCGKEKYEHEYIG